MEDDVMEISTATLANRELALNRANQGQDNLQRLQEKSEEARKLQEESQPTEVRRAEPDKQGRIDIYA
jgi:hypothetical protein